MYKITESTVHNGHLLHRIEATSTMCFGNFIIKPGTKGGLIESESNLGETAWVADNAMVYDDAVVSDHAVIYGNAIVKDCAKVYGYAKVGDKAIVRDHAKVFGNARVIGEAIVSDEAVVSNSATIMESAIVSDKARVLCHAVITDEATICGEAVIGGNANISDSATVYGKVMDYAMLYGNARVNKNARISNHAIIYNNACINGKVGGSAVVAGVVYGSVKGSCTLGSDVIIGEDVDFDCSVSISEKLALESNDDFVYVRCGSGKFLYVKSKDRFFGEFPNRDESERVKKIIKTI